MSLQAIVPDYQGQVRDRMENFNGNQLVYVGWDKHMMFCAAFAFSVPPELIFKALIEEVMAEGFSPHPEYQQVNWATAEWLLDGQPFIPQMDVALKDQGIGHKSLLRFQTPELKGFQGADV
ncbi:phenol hydroxylase subunit P4 [Pontibacter sp. JAM-7]|uniref:phenol hydroxylase subunit P4 n=1 Tax=Pontibacter sp. JAM-7 TaxID=3366581 RepID=UPI003AF68125